VTRGPTLPADNTLDLVDSNPVVFCDLLPRHPVARQGADATVLGSGYLAGLMPDCRPSPYLLLIGRWCSGIKSVPSPLMEDLDFVNRNGRCGSAA
jgi:hypothetical protein